MHQQNKNYFAMEQHQVTRPQGHYFLGKKQPDIYIKIEIALSIHGQKRKHLLKSN